MSDVGLVGGSTIGSFGAGALAGTADNSSISQSYATGTVSGSAATGGLVGTLDGTLSDSYWDTTTGMLQAVGEGLGTTINIVAVDNTTAYDQGIYASLGSFDTVWYMVDGGFDIGFNNYGQTRPFLRWEYSTTITNAHQLQLVNMDLSAVQGQQGLVAQIVFGRLKKEDPVRLIIELPRGVWLPGGVSIQSSEKAMPIALAYTRCLNGCLAEMEMKNDQLHALKDAPGPGSITFVDGTQRKVQLPLSFKGFSAALAASLSN